jgi:cold shock CspA family protein
VAAEPRIARRKVGAAKTKTEEPSMRIMGEVEFFSIEKYYGFIRELRHHGTSQFFHLSDVEGRVILSAHDLVSFEIVPSLRKPEQTCAVRIKLSKREEAVL